MWRNTALYPRFGPMDARVSLFILIWFAHMRWWTFYIAIGGIAFFTILLFFRISAGTVFRFINYKISGKRMSIGTHGWRYRRRARY